MEMLDAWWQGLGGMLKIYWAIAVPFTTFFVLQLILIFFGGGDHPDDMVDVDVETDHGISFQFLTLKSMVGFFTVFSWTGIACIQAGFSQSLTLILSTLAGLLMMCLMAGMFYLISKASADGTMKIQKAIGVTGEVYLTIPSKQSGIGKVQVKVMGSLRTLEAMTDDEQPIRTGKVIKVSQIISNNILLVTEKIN